MVKKILILAANPRRDLKLSQEIRDIEEGLKRSPQHEQFELVSKVAVRPKDLQRALLDINPRIVHFCGHGSGSEGLVLENDTGHQQLVTTKALSSLFKLFTNRVECVLLNTCYSKEQADEIVKHINCVIGMQHSIRDDAAIAFTVGFYEALASGETIESAYEFGCNRIQLEINRSIVSRKGTVVGGTEPIDSSEHLIPVLLKNPNPVYIPTGIEEKLEILSQSNNDMTKENIDNRSGGIYFGDKATVEGGDKNVTTTTTNSREAFPKDEVLQLLAELKASIKEASIDEDEKDIVTGQVAAAIIEAKQTDVKNSQESQKNIGKYLADTKTILEGVKDIGEISNKAFPIMVKLAQLLGIRII